MHSVVAAHDALLRRVIEEHDGWLFKHTGDGVCAAFASPRDALDAAVAAQLELDVPVRMGVATGEAELRSGDYFGRPLNRAARVMAAGHGGQVLVAASTAELLEGVDLLDLGVYRLRDLSEPLRLFQVRAAGLREQFPALRTLEATTGNLRPQATSFVGRQHELAEVAEAVRGHRLVTITGAGGVGKTRLGVQVAAELASEFREGVWLCELAAAANEAEMGQVVAQALGVVPRPQMTFGESIVDFLRSRELLLVLDDCEHLVQEAAELAQAIMAGAPQVRVLATSREGLGVPGEHYWPLRTLSVPPAGAEALASDAVRLFVDRAAAVVPGFALDDTNEAAIVEVCRRLDGIPLAIELAAARVTAMSPPEIAGHLDELFRLLTGGPRTQVERHKTMRAAIGWSYSLVPEAERAVFDRLGVFPASFDEAAAVAVCSGDGADRWGVIDALAGLVAKSMVVAERLGGVTRYSLLETLRQFAREQCGTAIDELRRLHAVHYAAFSEQAGDGLRSPDELRWRPRLTAEVDNLRAATSRQCANSPFTPPSTRTSGRSWPTSGNGRYGTAVGEPPTMPPAARCKSITAMSEGRY
jgi:predicted ATPase